MTARSSSCCAVLLGALVSIFALATSAVAKSGTWGVAQVPYAAGTICTAGNLTSPLVRWNFGDAHPDFLLHAVTSDGVRDSAQLPVAGTANRVPSEIQPGQYGFASAGDIATYAALLDRYGSSRAAAVALALIEHSDATHAPSCVPPTSAAGLVAQAQRFAGPYQVSLSIEHRPTVLGSPNSVHVRVIGAAGSGAPGVRVSLTSSAGAFGGNQNAAVTTGADGTASASFTVPDDYAGRRVSFAAHASVPVGLQAVAVSPQFGQPGPYAPTAFVDEAQTYAANTSVKIDTTADPHVVAAFPSAALVQGAAVTPGVTISGMRGHTGEAQVTITGPRPFDKTSLCAHVSTSAKGASGYDSGDIDIHGDQRVRANEWTPQKAGCYVVHSHVVTNNAIPKATANGSAFVITVLDSKATVSTTKTVLGTGPLAASVKVEHAHGLAGSAGVRVLGPVRPADNDCTGVDWSKAHTATTASQQVHGDGTYNVQTGKLGDAGCYELVGSLALTVPSAGSAKIPVSVADDSRIAYVLDPVVTLSGDASSVSSPRPVGTHITVSGTFGQAGHLHVAMLHGDGGEFGCARVDYSHASNDGSGPTVAFSGDGTYAVPSGPTRSNGCYTLVPGLVMDANKDVTATGRPGADGSTIVAGLSAHDDSEFTVHRAKEAGFFGTAVWTSVIVYVGLAVLAAAILLRMVAVDDAGGEPDVRRRPLPGLDTFLTKRRN